MWFWLQLKTGEIHASTEVAAELIAPGGPMEVQHFGYAVMQHLVGRSDHRSPSDAQHQRFASHLSFAYMYNEQQVSACLAAQY